MALMWCGQAWAPRFGPGPWRSAHTWAHALRGHNGRESGGACHADKAGIHPIAPHCRLRKGRPGSHPRRMGAEKKPAPRWKHGAGLVYTWAKSAEHRLARKLLTVQQD